MIIEIQKIYHRQDHHKKILKQITPDIIPYGKQLKMIGRLTAVQIDQPPPLPDNYSSIQTINQLYLLSHVFKCISDSFYNGTSTKCW